MSGQGQCHLSEPFSVYSDVRVGRLSWKSGRGQCHLWEPKQMKGERDAGAGGGLLVTPLWWLWSEVPDRSHQTSDWGKVHFDLWFIVAGKVAWWWRCRERDEGWCSACFLLSIQCGTPDVQRSTGRVFSPQLIQSRNSLIDISWSLSPRWF